MVKPYKIFLLVILVFALAILPSLFFPKDGIKVFTKTLRYPNINELLSADSTSNELSLNPEINNLGRIVDSTLSTLQVIDTTPNLKVDTALTTDSTKRVDSTSIKTINADILRNRLCRIEFPDSNRNSLVNFFESLKNKIYNRKPIRVLHYGDSQIEGDRVTSYIRARLQAKFGGRGVGLVPALPQSSQPTGVMQSASSNWERVTLADHDRNLSGINRYGALGGYSQYTQSRNLFSKSSNEAWIEIQRFGNINLTARNFERLNLYYGYNAKPFILELNIDGKANDAEMMPVSNSLKTLTWSLDKNVNSFLLKFRGDESPLIFGISLESAKGILVDNIPIRGSSGIDFTKTDMSFTKDMLQILNAKLIILQFGVNVVPNVVDNYRYYENQLYNQLKAFQTAAPDASIILIGVSDVSRKEGLHYTSYPNIEKIRDAQRNAAHRAGVAFWDCFKAMGGKNSMATWENANPPLASKDFIHFTYRGANLIAEMFYSALMYEYESYINTGGLGNQIAVKIDTSMNSKSFDRN